MTDFVAKVKLAAPEARVLVDEAYFDYVDDPAYASAVPLAIADRRVLVTRTFSKLFGMAGLRVGYAIAHPETLDALRAPGAGGIMTGGMSSASLAAAGAALADASYIATERARNGSRRYTREKFEAAGFRVLPSSSNFVMIDVKREPGHSGGNAGATKSWSPAPSAGSPRDVRLARDDGGDGGSGAGDAGAARRAGVGARDATVDRVGAGRRLLTTSTPESGDVDSGVVRPA